MNPDGRWTSTRAVLLAAAGQNRWPPAGSYMAATGQDLMAADTQGFRAPSWDQKSVRDSVHEDSASAPIAAGQRPRPSFRHPHGETSPTADGREIRPNSGSVYG